jgi:hypothetical protein
MIVYDIETFPQVFTCHAESLETDSACTWEVSFRRDDRQSLLAWFAELQREQTYMIGFNSEGFDFPVLDFIYNNNRCTVEQIYAKAMSIIQSNDRFSNTVWPRDRFAPQIDLFKIYHFDNVAKSTSLKALQFATRASSVEDMPIEVGSILTPDQIDNLLIPYNIHDVKETKRFAQISKSAIDFRLGLVDQFGVEVMCWNDTKIGEKMLEQQLGDQVCYSRDPVSGRRTKRQTPRSKVALKDIIFPYIYFDNPEFQRIKNFMMAQVLLPSDIEMPDGRVQTKGVFTDLHAEVGGLTFHFGTGGVHASVDRQRYIATDEWLIRDIDVEGLYPNIAIANRLAPEHLGEAFITEYSKIPVERKKHAKGTIENAAYKLAANGAWGKSNSQYSVFFDPKYAMTIPINGQLLICMLVEKLVTVPTLRLIQANTDGVTYMIHRDHEPTAAAWCKWWEAGTMLRLESVDYSRMWIRDVNNYIAESTSGKIKLKGCYEYPDPKNYHQSIANMSPPGWHKDWSAVVIPMAAVAAMMGNIDPAQHVYTNMNPFDFMLCAKAKGGSRMSIGDQDAQKTTRYYMSRTGAPLSKYNPPPRGFQIGWPKKASGVSDQTYLKVMQANSFQWDETVCTKNRSYYDTSKTSLQSGYLVRECNLFSRFDFADLDYDWYIGEARKLVI